MVRTSIHALRNFYSSGSLQDKLKMLDVLAMVTGQTLDISHVVFYKVLAEWTQTNQACASDRFSQ